MMSDRTNGFIEKLIRLTKNNKVVWEMFSGLQNRNDIIVELVNGRGYFDYNVNSIREYKSYYLKSGDGYVFLFEIYHGNPEVTSPAMDTLGLMIKINDILPLECLSIYSAEEQELLEQLKLLINAQIEERYVYPDIIYDFMDSVGE